MKTTIDIAEPLLREAKRVAAKDRTTLRALVEQGLRGMLEVRQKSASFRLRRASFRGRGLQPDLAGASWERLRDVSYTGRGA